MKLRASSALYGYGTSEGVTKSWDTRGRSYHNPYSPHGVHVDIFDRPERPNQYVRSVRNYFQHDAPSHQERERIKRMFDQSIKIGKRTVNLADLTPMQKTILDRKVRRVRETLKTDPDFFVTKKVPAVFMFEGKQYIMDGHHRLAYDGMIGNPQGQANIYTMPRSYRG